MKTIKSFEEVLSRVNDTNLEDIALDLFRFQAENNPLYKEYADRIGKGNPTSLAEIPFLPISFFKTHRIRTGNWEPAMTFTSSGTTGMTSSRHDVIDPEAYLRRTEVVFNELYGSLQDFHVMALLPSYLEREGSSLVVMADYFIRQSGSPHSGFFLNDHVELLRRIEMLRSSSKRVLLLAVSFALLDLAEQHPSDLGHCIVMETGGMKGRRRELTRDELHGFLTSRLNITAVHSEYGMTELFSQAYSKGEGRFFTPHGMKVLIRDINDPFSWQPVGKTGGINVIDLANVHSCAFIETQDLGKMHQNGTFEVLGRMDNSDVRGCNLLVE